VTTRERLAITAALVIIALTAAAFWLSYAHLHAVAATHGLAGANIRAWAWPATLDLFIVAGEILMLRASLARTTDWWAVGLTVVGSTGSIALNVLGVGGNDPLSYVTAAVPPTAALLAFGALMRQIHAFVAERTEQSDFVSVDSPDLPGATASTTDQRYVICSGASGNFNLAPTRPPVAASSTPPAVAVLAPATTDLSPAHDQDLAPVAATPSPAPVDSPAPTERQDESTAGASKPRVLAAEPRQRTPRVVASAKKPPRRSMTEWVELAGPVFHAEFERLRRQPTGDEFAEAIKKARLGTVSASTAKNIRAEILDRAELPVLD
jgi:hypothetical protein